MRTTRLFDPTFYVSRYPDLSASGCDLVEHFLDYGGAEGRLPHPLFDSAFYLETNPDVAASGFNPLVHYVLAGAAEGRDPNPLFATSWYADRYLDGIRSRAAALLHYLDHPLNDASTLFHSRWYAGCHSNAPPVVEAPLAYYFAVGRAKGHLGNGNGIPEPGSPAEHVLLSGLFDAAFYNEFYPDVGLAGIHPFSHYMILGYPEGRAPTPLFDVGFYVAQVPECAEFNLNPVLHYLDYGVQSGHNPHPLFDTTWYVSKHSECVDERRNPLAHFIADQGRSTSPSLRFDASWYLDRHPDVAASGQNPLAHYLTMGMHEGRATRRVPQDDVDLDVTLTPIRLLTGQLPISGRVALLVSHAPNGRLKAHVAGAVETYRAAGIAVVLIVAADQRRTAIPESVMTACAAVYLRANAGFDFAAWAHVLRLDDRLLGVDLLILTNDSLIGPLDLTGFHRVLEAIDDSSADVVGLTENTYFAHHLQSFFLAVKPRCLSSYEFNTFMGAVVSLPSKNEVITQYETTFSGRIRAGEMRIETLFPRPLSPDGAAEARAGDRTILDWEALLSEGFPYVKSSLVTGEHRARGGEAVRQVLALRGLDLHTLDPAHRSSAPVVWGDLQALQTFRDPLRVAFLGPSNMANGLGAAARGYVKALHRTPWAVNIHPMRRPFHVHAQVTPDWQARTFDGDADVALVHFNGDSWDALLDPFQRQIVDRATRRVGLFVWEVSSVPVGWLPVIDRLDAIWVPTAFCAEIFRAVTPVPVAVVPYVVENEDSEPIAARSRASLMTGCGLDPGRRHVLYAFDGSSFLARKNPQALIRAFRASGLAAQGWQLVLKTKHVFDLPFEGERLLDLVRSGSDVVMIDRPMSFRDLATLFALCPIYASSHASEGFGLTIAEAMERGQLVVATDYGGSRDFLDRSCGFPVPAQEIRLSETQGAYPRGAIWGKVDEEALAVALRRAAEALEDGHAETIGRAARARIRERLSIAAVAAEMRTAMDRLIPEQKS